MLTTFLKAVRQPRRAARLGSHWLADRLFWDQRYAALREPKRLGEVPHDPALDEILVGQLRHAGFALEDVVIDVADYRRFVNEGGYRHFAFYYHGGRDPDAAEKMLEHYLAARALRLGPDDVYVNVASYDSPVPRVYEHLYGCRAYVQDLIYPAGLHGDRIGGDASRMPVPDGFATAMALHNSFEHFEGDSDVRFIREAGRVLRPGGRLCVLPLFLHTEYAVQTDPAVHPREGVPFEPDATLYCAHGWRNRHGRAYDVPHLVTRIRENLGDLRLTIGVVRNAHEVHPSCYVRFVARFERP